MPTDTSSPVLPFPKQEFVAIHSRSFGDIAYGVFLAALGAALFFLIVAVKARSIDEFNATPILIGYTIFVTVFELSRVIAAMFYKLSYAKFLAGAPALGPHNPFEPTVSFVIPCKDEGLAIRNTVTQCFRADYPPEKIEVIVVNDGSTDNTAAVLAELEQEYASLTVVTWALNRGKRHGMAEGFKRAKGEIIVQLDSDSYIVPETFRNLLRPFQNPLVGAVCAHADADNADENLLTKIQAAYYFMSFRILKAAESTYGVIFCCSGCSSAYRREAVLPIMDLWLNEKFLGLPVTWGDDRGLTNWALNRGYKTIYTDTARARTIVPTGLKQFLKQQIRWKKGWFVNSFFLSKFIFKKEPFVAAMYFLPLTLVTLATPFMAFRALVYAPLFGHGLALHIYVFGGLLVAALIVVYYRFVERENKYWPYLFVWAVINMLFLSTLLFYALATIQNRKWGTR